MTEDGTLRMMLRGGGTNGPLALSIAPFADSGVVRMRIVDPSRRRWEPNDVLLKEDFDLSASEMTKNERGAELKVADGSRISVEFSPFSLKFWGTKAIDGEPLAMVNSNQLFHFERAAAGQQESVEVDASGEDVSADTDLAACPEGTAWNGEVCLEIAGYWEDGLARFADGSKEVKRASEKAATASVVSTDVSESFGGHRDAVKNGATSVGVDVTFPRAESVFGLAEHATSMALQPTVGKVDAGKKYDDPYRFYNLDVFEYDLDVPMALYGSIPLAWGHDTSSGGQTVGAFWNNPSETFVDVEWLSVERGRRIHWISESGVVDLFLIASENPLAAMAKFASLVGAQELPPIFALGYHQCRWNYKHEKDVAEVHGQFEALDIPYDVLWLDIEHTDDKRYFTWDKSLFPNPVDMQKNLSATGRKMVSIVDPHIKRDPGYETHSEAERLGLYIKDKSGEKDFEGWCWPGSSSYLDFTSSKVRDWWAERFLLENYKGSTLDLYIWNDMNEPSVFNGPEVTMSKECLSISGIEHREWHNLYGMYFARATAQGLELRGRQDAGDARRSFVLTRSFFAGSQRWGAMWTGDNAAKWSHLEIAAPMILTVSMCGFAFTGADAGGFFGDTEPELMSRWIQAAAFTPFFRGHAHHDAKRREPWSFGEPWTQRIRAAIAERYALLPYWYALFAYARFSGIPVMRPMWAEAPTDRKALNIDDQWFVGSDLLVKPAVKPGIDSVDVYFPQDVVFFDTRSEFKHAKYRGDGFSVKVAAPLDGAAIPVFQRAGSIVPRQRRLRRSTVPMARDPYELTVAVDETGQAKGLLYLDDQSTYAFRDKAAFIWTSIVFKDNTMTATTTEGAPPETEPEMARAPSLGIPPVTESSSFVGAENVVERIIVLGLSAAPKRVVAVDSVQDSRDVEFTWDEGAKKLVLRKPELKVAKGWSVSFEF